MAGSRCAVLPDEMGSKIETTKILVVGAGGIGCELLKNLVLTGFVDVEVIDLDTIDVSNLNRQFLFRKEHVGKSKAKVAKESVEKFNPEASIVAYHDSVMNSDYGVNFFKRFTLVLNALDNRAARSHVNRMCLAADVPLVESGTAGYLGQVTVIKKGVTECYDCQPKAAQKSYPGCTIRNTPSEPIHCIVWAKHLFNQFFGEEDPDQDVSPDTEDPEAAGDAGSVALQVEAKQDVAGGIERKSTRVWSQDNNYDPVKLFNKLFRDDIKYLLSMENLWKKRRPPTPLNLDQLSLVPHHSPNTDVIPDQREWSLVECWEKFKHTLHVLKTELQHQGHGGILIWDKDDDTSLDFVTATSNLRSFIFGIPVKSRFDVKSMAGNIIPAIASTNAIISGLIVMEALKILQGKIKDCKAVYLSRQPNPRKRLLNPCMLDPPNPKCYVCSERPEVNVLLNTETTTVKTLEDKILKAALHMVAPDVEIDDGKGTILISSEEGETEENWTRQLSAFCPPNHQMRLKCDDYLQNYTLAINIMHTETLEKDKEFEIVGDINKIQAKVATDNESQSSNGNQGAQNGGLAEAEGDDLMIMDEDDVQVNPLKRKATDFPDHPSKKVCNVIELDDDDEEILL